MWRIDEAGQHHRTLEVLDTRPRAGQRQRTGIVADVNDMAIVDGHGPGPRCRLVHRVDGTVVVDRVDAVARRRGAPGNQQEQGDPRHGRCHCSHDNLHVCSYLPRSGLAGTDFSGSTRLARPGTFCNAPTCEMPAGLLILRTINGRREPKADRMDDVLTRDEAQVRIYPPANDLQPFVHRYMHGYWPGDEPHELRIPPTGGVFLSYVPGSPLRVRFSDRVYDERPKLFIGGQLRREQPVLESTGHFSLVGVELTPSGFYRLFRRNADRYTDDIADFSAEFPQHACWLLARLDDAAPVSDNIAIIEALLRKVALESAATPLVDTVLHEIANRRGIVSISKLADRHGMNARQLHRLFMQVVGIPPKHYAKIVQANAVIGALIANDTTQIKELALEHGYFDQAHFIRDFRRFVGMNPTGFLQSRSQFLRTFLGKASRVRPATDVAGQDYS
ncbi:MAG: helix-turn-helix domain-containing protein [Woeseiaceae bacterium]|nr:helix-turn-helix domain-containing protein [Woeseiaceae bacterium]